MARAITIAIYVWSINAMTIILNAIDPFHWGQTLAENWDLIDLSAIGANIQSVTGIGLFGLLIEFVSIFNILIQLILGPFIYVPKILQMVGIDPFGSEIGMIIVAAVWIPWALFLFGIITGRALKDLT